jgi:hypothetical protein
MILADDDADQYEAAARQINLGRPAIDTDTLADTLNGPEYAHLTAKQAARALHRAGLFTGLGYIDLLGAVLRSTGATSIDHVPNRDDAPTPLQRLQQATISTAQLQNMPPATPLVDGLLDLDSLALAYGASGSGKSFWAVDVAGHVVTGSWMDGRAVTAGPVVYVAAEGARGLGKRIAAWCQHHGIYNLEQHHPIHWVTQPVHLHDPAWAEAFIEHCANLRPVLVVIDTLARCSLGADENSTRDMGQLIEHADRIKRSTGACVLLVHHTGKDTSGGARGSSALKAAVDTEIEIKAADQLITVKVTKQKDHVEATPRRYLVTPASESIVLVPDRGHTDTVRLTQKAAQALTVLTSIEVPSGIASTVWQRACIEDGIAERTFWIARKVLLDQGLVVNKGTEKRPQYLTADRSESDDA